MGEFELVILTAVFLIAILYSVVGHGGGSGYLAIMAFCSISPNIAKPTALALNIFVSSTAAFQFYRNGFFSWKVFLPFSISSVPLAFFGGMMNLPVSYYELLLGLALIFAAFRLTWEFKTDRCEESKDQKKEALDLKYSIPLALMIGAFIGMTSGLIGIGGGIFLTPILFLTGWTEVRKAAGISAMFVLVNSVSGLLGNYQNTMSLSPNIWTLVIAAIIGGIIGSTLGSRYFNYLFLRRVLTIVLLIASLKLFLV